jgi:hypothetical protein
LKCKLCGRETESKSDYCKPHEKAYRNIRQKFEVWKKALNIEWKEYLKEIAENPLTGAWAKEVAESLLSNEA